ncbi:MAG: T9SS type A sorting domain-containing protein, partial [Bacteroidota bacterium]
STDFGGNGNVWEVSSNGQFVPFFEIEYLRASGASGASFEAFTLSHSSDCDHDCDGIPNRLDPDSDNDGCVDAFEAGHNDADADGVLGSAPVAVNEVGLVIDQGGYTGNTDEVITPGEDSNNNGIADACDENNCEVPNLDNIGIAQGNCLANNGAIYLSISDEFLPHTFLWSNGFTQEDLQGAAPGDYSVTVTTNEGCDVVFGPFTISDPCDDIPCIFKPKLVSADVTDATCGATNGAIDITVAGGDPPFTFSWTDGFATTEDVDNLSPGTYGVAVTDAAGCSVKFDGFVVGGGDQPELTNVGIAKSNCGQTTGAIYLSIDDLSLPHTFTWSNGATDEDLIDVGAGIYSVTMVDAEGCEQIFGPYNVPDDCVAFDASLSNRTDSDKGLILSPNPILQGQQLNVRFYTKTESTLITISDVSGRLVRTIPQKSNLEWNQVDLDISFLSKGVYYLKVNNKTEAAAFIVN